MIKRLLNDPKAAWWYLQGTVRQLLYDHAPYLLRRKIRFMYYHRIMSAKECFDNGECLNCGCRTPDLFFADKGCSKRINPCYPPKERYDIVWRYLQNLKKKN